LEKQGQHGAGDTGWYHQEDAEGQRPAFVLSCQDQKDEEHRQGKYRPGWWCLLFLIAHVVPGNAVAFWKRLVGDVLQHVEDGPRCDARCALPHDLRAARQIEAGDVIGTANGRWTGERRQGHHVPGAIPDKERPHLFDAIAVLGLCAQVHLPLSTKAVEIVDVRTTHEGLQGAVDTFWSDA